MLDRLAAHGGGAAGRRRAEPRPRRRCWSAVPLLYDTLWATRAAAERSVHPHDLTPSQDATSDRAAFERFAQSYSQPHRRALAAVARGQRDAAEEIGWWLLHRWIGRQPAAYRPESLVELLRAGGDEARCSRRSGSPSCCGRCGPIRASSARHRPDRRAGGAGAEDGVRERFVGYLLVAARALAIEAVALPEVIGEHLGIVDPVTAAALITTVRAARSATRGTALVLDRALRPPGGRGRAAVPRRGRQPGPDRGRSGPPPATPPWRRCGTCRPTSPPTGCARPRSTASGPTSRPGCGSGWPRTGCRNCSWASSCTATRRWPIRELYQNALDACRYREARTEYLRRTRDVRQPAWAGRIRFVQGVDEDGRPYLDCVDNGIGMGVRELQRGLLPGRRAPGRPARVPRGAGGVGPARPAGAAVPQQPLRHRRAQLLHAGRRDHRATPAGWAATASRASGCGCRSPAPAACSGSSTLGPGTESGTTIRLHLRRADRRCRVWTLCASVLWVADFRTEATDGAERQVWRPGSCPRRPARTRADEVGRGRPGRRWWPTRRPACGGATATGAILADGLWAGQELIGAVVNLSRELAPRLSVDRTKILAYREEDLERLLWQAVPALVDGRSDGADVRLAVHVRVLPAADRRRHLRAGPGRRVHAGGTSAGTPSTPPIAGCFRPDGGTLIGPDQLIEWRLTALAAAGRYAQGDHARPGLGAALRARPSDALLLSVDIDGSAPWLDPVEIVPLAHLVRAARRIGRSASEIAARLERARLQRRGRARDGRRRPGRPVLAQPGPGRLPAVAATRQRRSCCRTCSGGPRGPGGRCRTCVARLTAGRPADRRRPRRAAGGAVRPGRPDPGQPRPRRQRSRGWTWPNR